MKASSPLFHKTNSSTSHAQGISATVGPSSLSFLAGPEMKASRGKKRGKKGNDRHEHEDNAWRY